MNGLGGKWCFKGSSFQQVIGQRLGRELGPESFSLIWYPSCCMCGMLSIESVLIEVIVVCGKLHNHTRG